MSKRDKSESSKFVKIDRELAQEISNFLFSLGNQFVNVKNASGAFDCFKYSLDINPKNQPSVYNLGALYTVMGNLDGAARMFREAVRMKPDDLMAVISLGEIERKQGHIEESRKIMESVYKLDPDNYMILSALALLHYDCGELAQAVEWNEKALVKRPGDIHMLLNKTLINMTYGRWPENWSNYEYLLSYQKNERMKSLNMADAWSGQELPDKTLIIISDQGSGDALQFSRYFPEVKAKGKFGKIVYLVQPDLRELLSRSEGVDEAVGFGERLRVDYDAYSSLLGIMRVLQISPDNCARSPHVVTDPQLDSVWEHKVRSAWDGTSKKVGIVWAGDPNHGNDHARSIPLTQFFKLHIVSGIQFFSFQVGQATQQLTLLAPIENTKDIVDLGNDFRSFDDTASALKQVDLLITCDTSVAHLAGTMGVPCWVLVPNPPEWRWLTDVGRTNWYDSVRLYRQPTPRDWNSVFNVLVNDLQEFAR